MLAKKMALLSPPENPYYDLAAVRDINMFFGRTHVLRKNCMRLLQNNSRSH